MFHLLWKIINYLGVIEYSFAKAENLLPNSLKIFIMLSSKVPIWGFLFFGARLVPEKNSRKRYRSSI